MPTPAWEDLGEFLDESEFAFPAVITLQKGGLVRLSVQFDDPAVIAEMGDAYAQDDVMPTALCEESKVRAVRRGDSIVITFPAPVGALRYEIKAAAQPDGTGLAVLKLAKP